MQHSNALKIYDTNGLTLIQNMADDFLSYFKNDISAE